MTKEVRKEIRRMSKWIQRLSTKCDDCDCAGVSYDLDGASSGLDMALHNWKYYSK
jgi:hypothetical protein